MNLSMNKPCQEDWSAMLPSQQGKFCQQCQKEVVDFSSFSLSEIKLYFEQQTGETCGNFGGQQLEHFNAHYQALPTPSTIRTWTMAAVLTAVVALPSYGQQDSLIGVETAIQIPMRDPTISLDSLLKNTPKSSLVGLSGKVWDTNMEEPLITATIVVVGTDISTMVDIEGHFYLQVPRSETPIQLQISFFAYKTVVHSIVPNKSHNDLVIEMKESTLTSGAIGGVMFKTIPASKRATRAYKRQERKAQKRAEKDIETLDIK